jgi:hypothetical protein
MDYHEAAEYTASLFVLVVGVIILTNPVLGYSQSLPGSVFEWTFGGLLLASGLLLSQLGGSTEQICAHLSNACFAASKAK